MQAIETNSCYIVINKIIERVSVEALDFMDRKDIITAGIADHFCDRLGSKNDSTDLCGCQRNPWVYIHFIDHSDCILLP